MTGIRTWRSAGLDQLGPKHSRTEVFDKDREKFVHGRHSRVTVKEAQSKSLAARKVKVTLPKFEFKDSQ